MTYKSSIRKTQALANLLEEAKPADCQKAAECFSDGRWGWLAYDDNESNMCGGKPWGECFCATEIQREAADILNGKKKTGG